MASSSDTRAAWIEDPAGLRFIRRDLLPAVALVAAVFLAVGIALDRGNPTLYLVVLGLAAVLLALALGLAFVGRRIAGPQQLRIVLATTPATFVLVGMAGWNASHDAYFPGIPVAIAGIVAMVVGLGEPVWVLVPWALGSCVALVGGALLAGGFSASIVLPPAALVGQVGLAWLIRDGIERYHAERRAIVHQMAILTARSSPNETAAAIVELVAAHRSEALILRFSATNETVVVAASRQAATDGLAIGSVLANAPNAHLRTNSSLGPWLARWPVRADDEFGRRVAETGGTAGAYVPIARDGRPIGLVVVTDSHPVDEAMAALAERLPVLIEVADLAGSVLGPVFEAIDATTAAAVRLDRILALVSFIPVFQPISELASGRVVGFEALTRFDDATPEEVFAEAGLLGRLRELELATLTAALVAAERLPPNRWLSVNVSPALLADTATLRGLVGGSIRPIVLELSEHQVVDD